MNIFTCITVSRQSLTTFTSVFIAVSQCASELKIPITCKIRIFDDVQRTVEYAKMLERAGAKVQQTAITEIFHPTSKNHLSGGGAGAVVCLG